MTVLEVIQKSADFLARKQIDSPRLQAELLLAHLLKSPRMKLYLSFDRGLSDAELAQYRELVRRRGVREPLQHIVGSASFCGFEIAVSPAALIPRPETELLAEAAWQFLGAVGPATALDFGTGTGCIAIALALKCPAARIRAVDISGDALVLARKNADANRVADRIEFLESDKFAALEGDARFDLIVSNPPYIPTAELETLQPEVRDHDPKTALDGGADGLNFYRLLASEAGEFLKGAGKLMVELGDDQADAVRRIFETQKWIVEAIREDYTGRARVLIAQHGKFID